MIEKNIKSKDFNWSCKHTWKKSAKNTMWCVIGCAIGAQLTWWVVPIMLTVGFLTPWPYNYWRLKKFNLACH